MSVRKNFLNKPFSACKQPEFPKHFAYIISKEFARVSYAKKKKNIVFR